MIEPTDDRVTETHQDSSAVQPTRLRQLRVQRQAILRIAERRGAHNIRVFGSVARDEASPDSDIDFLVDFEPGRTVLDLSGLILDLEDLLGRRVDVKELRQSSSTSDKLQREAVPL